MKVLTTNQICKGFVICIGHMTANETYSFTTADTTKNGGYSQLGYCLEGSANVLDSNGNVTDTYSAGNLYDLKKHYNTAFSYTINSEVGGTWFCINPVPATKIYDGTLLTENTTTSYTGDGVESVVVCVNGTVTVNDKTLQNQNYVRILNGQTANVTVGAGSVALYFRDSGNTQG
jgi:hypothetical protein